MHVLLQNFLENHRSKDIDYVAVHVWPDNWNTKSTKFLKTFVRSRIEAAKELKKPFVLEVCKYTTNIGAGCKCMHVCTSILTLVGADCMFVFGTEC